MPPDPVRVEASSASVTRRGPDAGRSGGQEPVEGGSFSRGGVGIGQAELGCTLQPLLDDLAAPGSGEDAIEDVPASNNG
jgi:hypothetical protein